jgi:hypothetical protein
MIESFPPPPPRLPDDLPLAFFLGPATETLAGRVLFTLPQRRVHPLVRRFLREKLGLPVNAYQVNRFSGMPMALLTSPVIIARALALPNVTACGLLFLSEVTHAWRELTKFNRDPGLACAFDPLETPAAYVEAITTLAIQKLKTESTS